MLSKYLGKRMIRDPKYKVRQFELLCSTQIFPDRQSYLLTVHLRKYI